MDEKISIDFWVQVMRLLGFELLIMVFENEDLYVLKLEHKILYTFYFLAMGNLIQHYKQMVLMINSLQFIILINYEF